jgi:hypothetical protein
MIIKSSKFTDTQFHSIVSRIEGVLELLSKGCVDPGSEGDYEIVSVNLTADQHRFYGVVFYKWVEKKESPWKD